jgi:glutathione S-transferase
LRLTDEAEKKRAREELATGYLTRWGACVDRVLAGIGSGPFVAGDTLNVADIKLYIAARWFSSGTLDHIRKDVFADFKRLTALEQAVAAHPKIVEWYARA